MASRDKPWTKTQRANLQGDPAGFLLLYLKSQQDLTNRSPISLPIVYTASKTDAKESAHGTMESSVFAKSKVNHSKKTNPNTAGKGLNTISF